MVPSVEMKERSAYEIWKIIIKNTENIQIETLRNEKNEMRKSEEQKLNDCEKYMDIIIFEVVYFIR
jgi:hypothetical protein